MTTALPPSLTYGVFKGEIIQAITDTDLDIDDLPDRVGCTGFVTLTPTVTSVKMIVEEITLFLKPIILPLDDNGQFYGVAIATDNLSMNPHDWNYIVSTSVAEGSIASFPLNIPTDSVQDYTAETAVDAGTGVFVTKGEPGRGIVSASALNGELFFEMSDGTTLPPIAYPMGGIPEPHAYSHAAGGYDPVTPESIGAPTLAELEPVVPFVLTFDNALI